MTDDMENRPEHTLLIANRGEIAVRIIRTAKKMGIRTISVYTLADATSPHVIMADVSVPLSFPSDSDSDNPSTTTEGAAYLSPTSFLDICKEYDVTLLHPGYGFLSENAEFAQMVIDAGVTWLGPSPNIIRAMGLKHEARKIVEDTAKSYPGLELHVVPGSEGLLNDADEAENEAKRVGLPVIFKASAGGGGLGMILCERMEEVRAAFENANGRAESLFGRRGVFLERYYPKARHVEVQVFGDGCGNVIHLGERECSIQRRHQKIIEECPSPFLEEHSGLREKMCDAAVALCRSIRYDSAGTVEFLVDDLTGSFYFLEMNTRIQVEHPITEVTHSNLDLVEMMIRHGIAQGTKTQAPVDMNQATYEELKETAKSNGHGYAIEGRVYAENSAEGHTPAPGILQHVQLEEKYEWLRVDSWVSTGLQVTLHFDALLCKIIVYGSTRAEAISRFNQALGECQVYGPPNNIGYLRAIASNQEYLAGRANTTFLDTFTYRPCAMKVVEPGLEMTVQDLPGRLTGRGVPHSGPMDHIAFTIGNLLVGNTKETEGLEIIVVPGLNARLNFLGDTRVAITGGDVNVTVDKEDVEMWCQFSVPAGGTLRMAAKEGQGRGLRTYLLIQGGFPQVPRYLNSKSTSLGLGGYQGRSLLAGDFLSLEQSHSLNGRLNQLPRELVPSYPQDWIVYVLPGPHDDEDFLTTDGIDEFYSTRWRVSPSSNRMGIRLESPVKIDWARADGGEGGAHPSNILDNAYALGSVNINGDTPVILTNEGPDMGGYVCLCTVATGELWKLGQLGPGCSVQFRRIQHSTAIELENQNDQYLASVEKLIMEPDAECKVTLHPDDLPDVAYTPRLAQNLVRTEHELIIRQAGDKAILAEFGAMELDFFVRARVQAILDAIGNKHIPGITRIKPCIRSLMVHYDPSVIPQAQLLQEVLEADQSIPGDLSHMTFPGRKITFPIVLDDPWSKSATKRYMQTIRDKAVYLPSNVEYLAKNNGLSGSREMLDRLVSTDWAVFGVGFYLACPFLVPINPRSRLVGQKLNPSRTFTPKGSVGIAGPVAAIYPIDSPGGYQLFGRSLPAWQTWGKGENFSPDNPWLLEPFDQLRFEPVDVPEYEKLEKLFEQGRYIFKIESTSLSMEEYSMSLSAIKNEIITFRERQRTAQEEQTLRERDLLLEWEQDSGQQTKHPQSNTEGEHNTDSITIKAGLFASVWKITCKIGDRVESSEEPLLTLEAMKSEIIIKSERSHVGKVIKAFGSGIKSGAFIEPGDVLVVLV